MNNFEKLQTHIFERSVSKNWWPAAIEEWRVKNIFRGEFGRFECACGKQNILNVVVMENVVTGASAQIGLVCMKHFTWEDRELCENLFKEMEKLQEDILGKLSVSTVEMMTEIHPRHFTAWDAKFLEDTCYKSRRKLSTKQAEQR